MGHLWLLKIMMGRVDKEIHRLINRIIHRVCGKVHGGLETSGLVFCFESAFLDVACFLWLITA
jgi:hypothetical protein